MAWGGLRTWSAIWFLAFFLGLFGVFELFIWITSYVSLIPGGFVSSAWQSPQSVSIYVTVSAVGYFLLSLWAAIMMFMMSTSTTPKKGEKIETTDLLKMENYQKTLWYFLGLALLGLFINLFLTIMCWIFVGYFPSSFENDVWANFVFTDPVTASQLNQYSLFRFFFIWFVYTVIVFLTSTVLVLGTLYILTTSFGIRDMYVTVRDMMKLGFVKVQP